MSEGEREHNEATATRPKETAPRPPMMAAAPMVPEGGLEAALTGAVSPVYAVSANDSSRAAIFLRLQQRRGNTALGRLISEGQRQAEAESPAAAPRETGPFLQQADSRGAPLGLAVRAPFEAAFDDDFSDVRVHTGHETDRLGQELGARAFTRGRHVFLTEAATGNGDPSSTRTLAHELTHVARQRSAGPALQLQREEQAGTGGGDQPATAGPGAGFAIDLHGVLSLSAAGDGVSIRRYDWSVVREPPDPLSPFERLRIDLTVREAKEYLETNYPQALGRPTGRERVDFTFPLPLNDLRNEDARGADVVLMADAMKAALGVAAVPRAPEGAPERPLRAQVPAYVHHPPAGATPEEVVASQTQFLRNRIQIVRNGIDAGFQDQKRSESLIAKFAAFVAVRPAPDISRWSAPQNLLKSAEGAINHGDLDLAKTFIEMSESDLEDQERDWREYKAAYSFGDEVLAPVVWKASELLSLGLVDKSLFEASEKGAEIGVGAQMLAVGRNLGEKVIGILTFGGGAPAYEATQKWLEKNPNAEGWDAFAGPLVAGGEAGFWAVLESLLPISEIQTLLGTQVDPHGRFIDPTAGERFEAFFSGVIKVVSLGQMAHEEISARQAIAARGKTVYQYGRSDEPAKRVTDLGDITAAGIDRTAWAKSVQDAKGWSKFIKMAGEDSPEALRAERLRQDVAAELGKKYPSKRTGSLTPASDLDIDFFGPETEKNIAAAKADLEREFGLPWETLKDVLKAEFLPDPNRALMAPEARGAVEATRLRALRKLALEAEESPRARRELQIMAKEWGFNVEEVMKQKPEYWNEAKRNEVRRELDNLHAEYERGEAVGNPDPRLAQAIAERTIELNIRNPGAYYEPGAVEYRVRMREGMEPRRAMDFAKSYGDVVNNAVDFSGHLAEAKGRAILSREALSAARQRPGLEGAVKDCCKYFDRASELAEKYDVKALKHAERLGPEFAEAVKEATKIAAKDEAAVKALSTRTPEQLTAFLDRLEKINDLVLKEMDGIANYNFLTTAPALLTPVDRRRGEDKSGPGATGPAAEL